MVGYLEKVVLGWWVTRRLALVGGLPGAGSPVFVGYLEEVVLG